MGRRGKVNVLPLPSPSGVLISQKLLIYNMWSLGEKHDNITQRSKLF